MNKESCSSASQSNLQLEPSSASLIPQLWNPQNMVGYEQFQAHIVQNMDEQIEPQVHTSNMDTDELDQLLDEFEDVFVKTGEDSNRLNIESMMDKMANDGSDKEREELFTKKTENGSPRQFSAEELAPQIMIRKAKKVRQTILESNFYFVF
ncbi:unnamed protein product [Oikopleura dioica]|nr:unnamed protein product [Oikopleura dioica]CBY31051.1 unnamed protein product [Oikopleura dioica]